MHPRLHSRHGGNAAVAGGPGPRGDPSCAEPGRCKQDRQGQVAAGVCDPADGNHTSQGQQDQSDKTLRHLSETRRCRAPVIWSAGITSPVHGRVAPSRRAGRKESTPSNGIRTRAANRCLIAISFCAAPPPDDAHAQKYQAVAEPHLNAGTSRLEVTAADRIEADGVG